MIRISEQRARELYRSDITVYCLPSNLELKGNMFNIMAMYKDTNRSFSMAKRYFSDRACNKKYGKKLNFYIHGYDGLVLLNK